jgi:N-acetylmuramoyl-L-alanine amidase/Cell wall binding domain 2 (CWB2)
MPVPRHRPIRRAFVAVGVATLIPALAGFPAGAAVGNVPTARTSVPPASASAVGPTTATATTSATAAADVRQPRIRQVRLSGVNRAVLAVAPKPDVHAHGKVGALSAGPRLKLAVAAKVQMASPAALVAVTADAAFPTGTSIQVRVKERKHGWSDWTTLHVDPEHGPDPGSAEAAGARPGSDPLMTVDATKAQVRIDTPSGKLPRGTQLALVTAPTAASDARTGRVAAMATVGQPAIVTRAQWGADESWRSRAPYYTDNIRAGFIHHTASTSNYTPAQAAAQVRAIYAYHTKSLGHSDIDYNFVVDRFGRIYEGRAGGIDLPVLGGHTAGFNEHTFAAVALGNFETFSPPASDMDAIKDSFARLFAWKLGLSGVNPAATVQLVSAGYTKAIRYPKGSVATISATSSHQTVNYTSCPGKYLQAQLPSIRGMGAAYSDVVISAPSPAGQSITAGQRPDVTFVSEANRAVTWTAEILSPCSDTPVRTYTGATAGAGPIAVTWDFKDASGAPVLPATYTIRMTGSAADGTPVASVTSDLTLAPAPGGAWGPCANASRVSGSTSAATSVLWGRIAAPSSAAVVLTGAADAGTSSLAAGVAAAPLARSLGAPLLMTPAGSLAPEVAADIAARRGEVLIVGGSGVVSDATAGAVAALGVPVTRLAGATDAATAAAVAARMPAAASAVLVSPEGSPAHALAGAALAAARGVPVLIAGPSSVPAETVSALAGRPFTVVASTGLPDSAIPAGSAGRLAGSDASSASLVIGAAFPTTESAMVLPEAAQGWATGPVAAAAGVPLLFSPSPVLSAELAAFITARPALRATTTTVPGSQLSDQVLGATSRVLLGLPWAPPGVTTAPPGVTTDRAKGPTATTTRKVARANATPEPVRKGRTVKVSSKVKARFTDRKYRSVPAGVPFSVQFKASGSKKYRTVAKGVTTTGRATAKVKATKSGRYRIVVGSKRSASDYVRVKR